MKKSRSPGRDTAQAVITKILAKHGTLITPEAEKDLWNEASIEAQYLPRGMGNTMGRAIQRALTAAKRSQP